MRMESEVLQMTAALLSPPNQKIYGSITSGGS
jgi:glutamate/tyrosine decarboxylase-like PLP-dependent enzyme